MFLRGALYLSLAASIWGGMYVVSKYTLDFVPPITLLFLRYLVAGVAMAALFRWQNLPFFPSRRRGLLLLTGVAGFVSLAAQFIGTWLTSAHMGAVITTLSPLFLSVLAIFLLKEKMTRREGIAVGLGFGGVLIIVDVTGAGHNSLPGSLTLVVAAAFWGYYSVLARQAAADYTPFQVTTWAVWVGTVLALPWAVTELPDWSYSVLLTWPVFLSILYLGLIAMGVAFFSWNKGLSLLPAHQAGLFFFLQPVVGSLLGWLLLEERLTGSFFAGSGLILAGVYLALMKEKTASVPASQKLLTNQKAK